MGTEVKDIEAKFKSMREELSSLSDGIKVALEKQNEEIKKNGVASDKTGKAMDKYNAHWEQVVTDAKGLQSQVDKIQADFIQNGSDGESEKYESLGAKFVNSDAYKSWQTKSKESPSHKKMLDSVNLGSLFHKTGALDLLRKTITTDSGSGGALTDQFRLQQAILIALRPRVLRDLIPVLPLSEKVIEFPREDVFHILFTEVVSTASSGQKVILVRNARGFYPGQTIVIAPNTGSKETRVIDTLDQGANSLTVLTNLANTHAVDVEVTADKFIFTPETKIKPRANIKYTLVQENAKTLASFIPISRQMSQDAPVIQQLVDGRLRDALGLSEETQILYGDGSSDQYQGLMTNSGALTYAWSSGTPGDTRLDAIRRSMTLVWLANYRPSGVVLNPSDFELIETQKASDGHYTFFQVQSGNGVGFIWRVPIVETQAIDSGDFLAGAFDVAATLWDRMDAEVRIADQHEDFFVKNMLLLLAEMRSAFATYRPTSFVVGDFDNAPVP